MAKIGEPFSLTRRAHFAQEDFILGRERALANLQLVPSPSSRVRFTCRRAEAYVAKAAAFDETMAATLGIFSECGDLRSQPARSQASGTRNSE